MVLRVLVLLLLLPFGALAEDRRVQVTQTLGKDRLELWVELTDLTEATITVSAAELTNVANALPTTVDAAGRTRFLLASWRRVDRNQPWRVRDWKYRFRYGRRLAEKADERVARTVCNARNAVHSPGQVHSCRACFTLKGSRTIRKETYESTATVTQVV